jgi:hypothetical protein
MSYDVYLHSRPAMGREFYEGNVIVEADHPEQAIERAIHKVYLVHGHRDWKVDKVVWQPQRKHEP